jgi:hypothetical protein
MARCQSGRGFRRLPGLARLGAHSLARRCRTDVGRPASRPGRSFTGFRIWPELGAARRREFGFPGDHAGRHAADIGNFGAAQPERVAAAGLLLLRGVALAGGGRDQDRQRHRQQRSKPEMPCSKNRHLSPSPKFGGIVVERTRIRKHGRTAWPQHRCRGDERQCRCERGGGWYSWVGSNHRPPVPQTGALTN